MMNFLSVLLDEFFAVISSECNVGIMVSRISHKFGKYVTMITSVNIKGKEYIITGGNDHTIKIWHTLRGRLRLLKVIQNNEDVSTIVYLENYQMIASTHHKDYIKFFKLPHGKLEATVNLGLTKARNIFLMKDKNIIGVANLTQGMTKMVQLHPAGDLPEIHLKRIANSERNQ